MWILGYEIYADYDLLDFALAAAILAASGVVCGLLRKLAQDDWPGVGASENYR